MSLSYEEQQKLNKQLLDEITYTCYLRYSNETALEILTDLFNKGAVLTNSIPMNLLISVVMKNLPMLKLFDNHIDIHSLRSHNDNSLLHYVISRGNMDMLEYLLDRGCDIESANNEGQTPFLLACHIDIIKYLLRRGVNPFVKDKDRNSFDKHYDMFRNNRSIRGDRIKAKYALLRFLKLTLETQLGEFKTRAKVFRRYSKINKACYDSIFPILCSMKKAYTEYTAILNHKTEGPSEPHAIHIYKTIQTVEKQLHEWKSMDVMNTEFILGMFL